MLTGPALVFHLSWPALVIAFAAGCARNTNLNLLQLIHHLVATVLIQRLQRSTVNLRKHRAADLKANREELSSCEVGLLDFIALDKLSVLLVSPGRASGSGPL